MKEKLNEKQLEIYSKAMTIFGNKMVDKHDDVIGKILSTPDIDYIDYDELMIKTLFNDIIYDSSLFKKCIMPPFTILDTRSGEWRSRRSMLDSYLGSSVVGRQSGLTYGDKKLSLDVYRKKDDEPINGNTSQFDSLLCEIILKWFGFKECKVLDPFAGGHIRGTMAKLLGYDYKGIELSTEQVDANIKRLTELGHQDLLWINDDSMNVSDYVEDNSIDLVFSCPPYGDLEKYTDNPKDLSNMDYIDFFDTYEEIIKRTMTKLKHNRFAVFVVGDFRDKQGFYRGFVKDTIQAFEDAGGRLYNEIILLNSVGSGSLRASGAFRNRKMTKIHQNVLVFFKGDPSTIKDTYGDIDDTLPIPQFTQSGLF